MFEAFMLGGMLMSFTLAGTLGVVNSEAYQQWQAEQAAKDAVTVYTFGSADGITTSDAAIPGVEIVEGGD